MTDSLVKNTRLEVERAGTLPAFISHHLRLNGVHAHVHPLSENIQLYGGQGKLMYWLVQVVTVRKTGPSLQIPDFSKN